MCVCLCSSRVVFICSFVLQNLCVFVWPDTVSQCAVYKLSNLMQQHPLWRSNSSSVMHNILQILFSPTIPYCATWSCTVPFPNQINPFDGFLFCFFKIPVYIHWNNYTSFMCVSFSPQLSFILSGPKILPIKRMFNYAGCSIPWSVILL
jgi:hypothetical protein